MELVLRDGATIEGKVRAVERDAVRLRITRSSNQNVGRTGERAIPRSSVSLISVETKGALWRTVMTFGVPAVALVGVYVASSGQDDPVKLSVAAGVVAVGGAVGGYFIGRHLDSRKRIRITITPD